MMMDIATLVQPLYSRFASHENRAMKLRHCLYRDRCGEAHFVHFQRSASIDFFCVLFHLVDG